MKPQHFVALVVGLFFLALWYGEHTLAVASGMPAFRMPDPGNVRLTAALEWTANVFGVVIAAVSALHLLQCALQGAKLRQLLPVVVALFGGLLLYQRHWAVAVALAAIVVGWLVVVYLSSLEDKDDGDGGGAS